MSEFMGLIYGRYEAKVSSRCSSCLELLVMMSVLSLVSFRRKASYLVVAASTV